MLAQGHGRRDVDPQTTGIGERLQVQRRRDACGRCPDQLTLLMPERQFDLLQCGEDHIVH